jgi:hypothetical protein
VKYLGINDLITQGQEDNMINIDWLIEWFKAHCNDDWEHENQIQIYTTDNPGWTVIIDLKETSLEGIELEYQLMERSDDDWFGYSLKEGKYKGSGDLNKLSTILSTFKQIVENFDPQIRPPVGASL